MYGMLSRKPAYCESELSLTKVRLGSLSSHPKYIRLYGRGSSRLIIDENNESSWDGILQSLLVDELGYTQQKFTLGNIIHSFYHKKGNGKEAEIVAVEFWSVPF